MFRVFLASIFIVCLIGPIEATAQEPNYETVYDCLGKMGAGKAHFCLRVMHRPCAKLGRQKDDRVYVSCSEQLAKKWRFYIDDVTYKSAESLEQSKRIELVEETRRIYNQAEEFCNKRGIYLYKEHGISKRINSKFCFILRFAIVGYYLEKGEKIV
ncbi:MAG: hypothetical protein AAGC81_16280 [Pseudomonadota bacterium]